MNHTFKIYTLGCKVNQYDSGRLERQLYLAGFLSVKGAANLAIVNTCAVTKTAGRKGRNIINKARQENPQAKIIIMGCWVQEGRDQAADIKADLIWGTGELDKLVGHIKKLVNYQEIRYPVIFSDKLATTQRARYFIKIQDGCEQYCTYCIVPYARGGLRSRPEREVIDEVKRAVSVGFKEIILSGIHLGWYGKESGSIRPGVKNQNKKNNLVMLLRKMAKIKNLGRLRLSSIEITEIGDELLNLMAGKSLLPDMPIKICRHLHLPLQSGSDKILKSMNRPYDTEYYENKIKKIRKLLPDIAITTDVIVGFPDETEDDFKKTRNFIKKIKFSRLHVFPFSAHEKTPAFKMPGQVDEKIKIARAAKLRKLGKGLENNYREKFIGRVLDVAVERQTGGEIRGKTEYYFDVKSRIDDNFKRMNPNYEYDNLVGKIVRIKFDKD